MVNVTVPTLVLAIGIIVVIMGFAILAKIAKLQSAVSDTGNRPAASSAKGNQVNDGAVIAAIAAAIAVYTGGKNVAIKSVRRVQSKSSVWAQAGRRDQMY